METQYDDNDGCFYVAQVLSYLCCGLRPDLDYVTLVRQIDDFLDNSGELNLENVHYLLDLITDGKYSTNKNTPTNKMH